MLYLFFLTFSTATAVAGGLAASVFWWRQLQKPWLFLAISTLAMLGLERFIVALWSYREIAFGDAFLEHAPPVTAEQIANPQLSLESILVSVAVLALGLPLLNQLRKAIGRR